MELAYQIIYSKRKNLGITVERDRSVVVRAPFGLPEEKIALVVESKKRWLYEKINHIQKYTDKHDSSAKELVSGESMPYLGRNYRLQVFTADRESIEFKQKFIIHKAVSTNADQLFKAWYKNKAKQKISPRVALCANSLGLEYSEVKIADMKYRWGSCTPQNNIIFNWRIIKSPIFVLEYLVVHELVHLIESNHTPEFWNILSIQIPSYEKAKKWLKENGYLLEIDF